MVRIQDYPQLALICWNRDKTARIDDAEALALYELNWDLVDRKAIGPAETVLIERLTREYGSGILNV